MGYGKCGVDKKGRLIGYMHQGYCDQPGCDTSIDRGLGHACGGEHGETPHSCGEYFCAQHLYVAVIGGRCVQLCQKCLNAAKEAGVLEDDGGEDE